MTRDVLLPPHLQQFIRDQVAAGRFRSEGDVIQTALRLLEDQTDSREADRAWLKEELDRGLCSKPAEPATKAFWDRHRDRVRAAMTAGRDD